MMGRGGTSQKWILFLHWLARCHPERRGVQAQKKTYSLGPKTGFGALLLTQPFALCQARRQYEEEYKKAASLPGSN